MLEASPCPGLQRTLNTLLLTTMTWSHQTTTGGEDRVPFRVTERQSSPSPDPPGGWAGVWGCGWGLPLCGRQLRDPVLARFDG